MKIKRQRQGRELLTRFDEFDDAEHPANKWWEEHGQFMMSGGGRTQFIWACRGWIAHEQFASGLEVTGDYLHETKPLAQARTQPAPRPPSCPRCEKDPHFTLLQCGNCGIIRNWDKFFTALPEAQPTPQPLKLEDEFVCSGCNRLYFIYWDGRGWIHLLKEQRGRSEPSPQTVTAPQPALGWIKPYCSTVTENWIEELSDLLSNAKSCSICDRSPVFVCFDCKKIFCESHHTCDCAQELAVQKPPTAEPMSQESILERIAMASERQDAICAKARFACYGEFGMTVFDLLTEMYNAGYAKANLARSTALGWIAEGSLPEVKKVSYDDFSESVFVQILLKDGRQAVAQYCEWLENKHPAMWDEYCGASHRPDEVRYWKALAAPPAPHKET